MTEIFNFNNQKYNFGKITLIYYSDKKSRETFLNENKNAVIELSKKGNFMQRHKFFNDFRKRNSRND